MTDREKVIKGLECCGFTENMIRCDNCPYDRSEGGCFTKLRHEALELLKEQEPIEPCSLMGEDGIWQCGRCGAFIGEEECYCHECGRKVKWNDQGNG